MSYIEYDKSQLINLGYMLDKEFLRSNRAGSYASTTLIGCNTRKYHGLLISPQPAVDGGNHVLLSTLDETVIQHEAEFNLGIHKFKGEVYLPRGHKYLRDLSSDPIPKLTYRVGGVVLTKEQLFSQKDDRLLTRYTLVDAHSPTTLRFKPFLAFRNVHTLTRANVDADTGYEPSRQGIRVCLYQGYTPVYMQFSRPVEYTHAPEWYYDIEYSKEKERGYAHQEDLFVPGFFELPIKKGESIIFSAGTSEVAPGSLKRLFNLEVSRRIPRDSFEHCLVNSAQQFLIERGSHVSVVAGFPWYASSSRESFISSPGLFLTSGNTQHFMQVLQHLVDDMEGPLFPVYGERGARYYNAADAPLWFFWSLQQYILMAGGNPGDVWKRFGPAMQRVIEGFQQGTLYNIRMMEHGLVYAGEPGNALTWMNARALGQPVTPRIGYAVEVNALWYNALMFAAELATMSGDGALAAQWETQADQTRQAFIRDFWIHDKKYLADYVNGDFRDLAVRPNQIMAVALPYTMLDEEQQKGVVDVVSKELLTPRGLRTLSPKNPAYLGDCHGDETSRARAYHQGTAWPWLIGLFADAILRVYGKSGFGQLRRLFDGFEPAVLEAGIGTVSEVYDGDPPQRPGGAISYAPSVAELLRLKWLIDKTDTTDKVRK